MNICIITIVLMIIVILYIVTNKKLEGFSDYNPNMLGYEEGLPNEYRKIDYKTLENTKRNHKEFIANNWDLRFPYMVDPRYSYDDKPDRYIDVQNNVGVARLKELPLNLDVDTNYINPSNDQIYYQGSRICLQPQDLRNEYLNSNTFLDKEYIQSQSQVNGFDYDNSQLSTFNSANGTSDSYYLEDKGY